MVEAHLMGGPADGKVVEDVQALTLLVPVNENHGGRWIIGEARYVARGDQFFDAIKGLRQDVRYVYDQLKLPT